MENQTANACQLQADMPEGISDMPEGEKTQTKDTPVSPKREDFERLIRGEYKAEFDERVRKIIDKRFRDVKGMKEQAARVKPVMDALTEKYGETDPEKLIARLLDETQASEKNKRETDFRRTGRAVRTVLKWRTDADVLFKERPSFDLKTEMKNHLFKNLLRAGVDMKDAYAFVHRKETMAETLKIASARMRESALEEMRARMLRPTENGAGGYGAGMAPTGVNGLTKAQREEIEKRAARGEKVYFS